MQRRVAEVFCLMLDSSSSEPAGAGCIQLHAADSHIANALHDCQVYAAAHLPKDLLPICLPALQPEAPHMK